MSPLVGLQGGWGSQGMNKLSFNMETITSSWPRFLVIQDIEGGSGLLSLSPFAIAKGIKGLASEPKSVKKIKNGLLVEVAAKAHSDLLLKSNKIAEVPIKVSVHRTLNTRRGVIRCRELSGMTEEDIVSELASQHVTQVKRVFVDRGQKATNTYFLTFEVSDLPKEIKVGYMNVKVDPFIPKPLRCYKCQQYGHGATRCTHEQRCSRCGATDHKHEDCSNEPNCIHCETNHPTSSPKCPRFLKEKQIQKIRTLENISFHEARQKVEAESKPTFASVIKATKRVCDAGTQTHYQWVKTEKPVYKLQDSSVETKSPNTEEKQVDAASSAQSTDRFDLLKKYAAEVNPSSPILNWQSATKSKSTSELPGASSEVGPTPPSGRTKNSGRQFPLKNNQEKKDKFTPSGRVSGPSKK